MEKYIDFLNLTGKLNSVFIQIHGRLTYKGSIQVIEQIFNDYENIERPSIGTLKLIKNKKAYSKKYLQGIKYDNTAIHLDIFDLIMVRT